MKKILITIILGITLLSCTNKVKDVASFEHDGAWFWVLNHQSDATKEDVYKFVNRWANPHQTSFFIVYPDTINLSELTRASLPHSHFIASIVATPPTYAVYKMPNDDKVHEDALWLFEQYNK